MPAAFTLQGEAAQKAETAFTSVMKINFGDFALREPNYSHFTLIQLDFSRILYPVVLYFIT